MVDLTELLTSGWESAKLGISADPKNIGLRYGDSHAEGLGSEFTMNWRDWMAAALTSGETCLFEKTVLLCEAEGLSCQLLRKLVVWIYH